MMRDGGIPSNSAICLLDSGSNARVTAPNTLFKFANTVSSFTSENASTKTWVYNESMPTGPSWTVLSDGAVMN